MSIAQRDGLLVVKERVSLHPHSPVSPGLPSIFYSGELSGEHTIYEEAQVELDEHGHYVERMVRTDIARHW